MKKVYCDKAIIKEFESVFKGADVESVRNVYVLYEEKPKIIEKDSVLIVNGDNRKLLKSLEGTAGNVITCGMSGVSTFTFSSVNDGGCVLCLQRTVELFNGKLMHPQEIPVSLDETSAEPDRLILILAFAFLAQQSIKTIKLEE